MGFKHFRRLWLVLIFLGIFGSERAAYPMAENFPGYLWPNGRIPYKVASVIPAYAVALLQEAMAKFNVTAKVRWVPATPNDKQYVVFGLSGSSSTFDWYDSLFVWPSCAPNNTWRGYCSYGTTFLISLTYNFMNNVAIPTNINNPVYHNLIIAAILFNLGLSVGMLPEHARPDRDNYILVYPKNLAAGEQAGGLTTTVPAGPGILYYYPGHYDYASVMQVPANYGSKAVSVNTVVSKTGQNFGYASNLSQGDIFLLNQMYH